MVLVTLAAIPLERLGCFLWRRLSLVTLVAIPLEKVELGDPSCYSLEKPNLILVTLEKVELLIFKVTLLAAIPLEKVPVNRDN